MLKIQPGSLVEIGQELAFDSEYLGDKQTTFTENGKIYAGVMGILKVDERKRKIYIETHAASRRIIPRPGDYVIGVVTNIREISVGVSIHILNGRLLIESGINGSIHIANASNKYVKRLNEVFQVNDIVRAKVIGKDGSDWKLALNAPKCGVIYTECRYCSHEMVKIGFGKVKCPYCDNVERKVLAPDYGYPKTKIVY